MPLHLIDNSGQAEHPHDLGLDTTRAVYEQGSGREIRHSIGTRLFNHQAGASFEPGFDYNWELIYQLGTFAQNYINAWTVSSETGFDVSDLFHAQAGVAGRRCQRRTEYRWAEH